MLDRAHVSIIFFILGVCFVVFLLSGPEQLIAWEDLSPKWPVMCLVEMWEC